MSSHPRAHGGQRIPRTREGAFAAEQAAHPAAAEGERRLHVAAGRSADRPVHRQRTVRVPVRIRQTVGDVGHHRPARGAGEDRPEFPPHWAPNARKAVRSAHSDGQRLSARDPLQYLDDKFAGYLAARRSEPRATTCCPAWRPRSTPTGRPELIELVKPATFLFAAGQGDRHETVVRCGCKPRRPTRAAAAVARKPGRHTDVHRVEANCECTPHEDRLPAWSAGPPNSAECHFRPAPS